MPAVVEFPTIVKEALEEFGDQFANEPERTHFGEYLTGLFIAEHKNVSAINRQFVQTTDQSCLNRWLTQVPWDVSALNRRRLAWLHIGKQGVHQHGDKHRQHAGHQITGQQIA